MTAAHEDQSPETHPEQSGESPENLPPKAWATLITFAVFVVLFGTCASTFMFN